MTTSRLIPLGTNALIPSFGRQTVSCLYATEKNVVLLDAGTGVGRLLERIVKDFLDDYSSLSIILSNYSYDRMIGIPCLSELWNRQVTIYAPGPPLFDRDPQPILEQLLHPTLGTQSCQLLPDQLQIVTISQKSLKLDDIDIYFLPQSSPGGSVSIRLQDSVAYIPNYDGNVSVPSFIEGCDYLLHEIPLRQINYSEGTAGLVSNPLIHNVIELAVRAQNKFVIPINLRPELTEDDVSRLTHSLRGRGIIGIIPLEGTILLV
jgi:hypothetical protein